MRLLFLALVTLLCAGCIKPPPPGVTRLQFYLWGEGVVADLERQTIAAFERENPDIKIELTTVIGSYSEKMQALIVGGILPDIMAVDPNSYYEWADRGLLLDVTDLMQRAAREEKMTFMPIVTDELPYKGRFYAVPYGMCGVIPQVNLDAFERAGIALPPSEKLTWEWIAEVAPRMARRAGNPNGSVEFFCSLPDMTSLLMTFGGQIFDDPRRPTKILVNSPQAEEMCRFVRRIMATHALISRSEATTSSNWGTEWEMFLAGQTALHIHGIWQRPGAWRQAEQLRWDARPFPAGPTGLRVTAYGAQLLGISAKTKHAEAAQRFLRFYLTKQAIKIHTDSGSFMPLFRELLDDPAYRPFQSPPSVQYYYQTMERGMSRVPVNGPGLLELRSLIDSRLAQVSAEPDVPIPTILRTLEDEIRRWLEREKRKGFYL